MKMQDLPVEIQAIAASMLREKIESNDRRTNKEPVAKLAHEVREAFTTLYSPAESEPFRPGSDYTYV
ncbi:hypothetical protein FGS43_07445 [Salmonella enterica]|uniref:Uncharacterized protein n=1 Tax=Salmonella enterica TaxID=28901 RepID=A0A5V1PEF9_SALER|nr:hypothetical protein [Salmonella enterica subsp. enterica serovar Oranienburg]EAA9004364.1 hypothetical protein [Salmonella enterica]EAS6892667.1 hypothetical protein [Salmonella enterica subsp. enterica serovar Poona]EBH7934119.1 hypothetical protein [Salmonella enterica subsp. enterica serovar Rubislaw]EBR8649069.1 hypothetical protein [Salmonella enterica subsp. enterica serovar Muenchen]EBS4389440.1 hypothetical protein [Salmonella enterica subsp. enterica serovar Panama]EBS5588993.1 h